MIDPALRDALAAVREDRLIDLTCRLIDQPSPTGSEKACAELLARSVAGRGIRTELQDLGGQRANLLATLGPAPSGAAGVRLMLCGHLDTTGFGDPGLDEPGGDLPRAELRDGVVSGLGAFNQKGGLAAAAEALLALADAGVWERGQLTLGALAGESGKAPVRGSQRDYVGPAFEGGGVGARWLLTHAPSPDMVVITGPSDLQVVHAQTGYVMVKIELRGRAIYHASKVPGFDALSGIDLASRVVQALSNWGNVYRERYKLDCGTGTLYPNVTVGAIEGGWPYKPAQSPDVCNLYVDLRVPPGMQPEQALTELDGVVQATLSQAGSGTHSLEVYQHNAPGSITPLDHPLTRAAFEARNAVLGNRQTRTDDEQLAISNDGKVFGRHGIAWVKCGPGGLARSGPRINVEQVEVRQLVQAAQIYVTLALGLARRVADDGPRASYDRSVGPTHQPGEEVANQHT